MAYRKYLLSFSSILLLGSCAYAVESSNQDITFLTPNAENAKCFVYIDKLKYQVYPPYTLNIKKSSKDMEIVCNAPGNRKIEMSVPAQMSKRAIWGSPAGMAWDYASSSLYYYPSVIAIDFSDEELKPNPLPSHNNRDIRQPETYDLEEFGASQPRLNSDKNKIEMPIIRRGEEIPKEYMGEHNSGDIPVSDEKSDLQSVLDGLTETPPAQDSDTQDEAVSEPIQIYPGQ